MPHTIDWSDFVARQQLLDQIGPEAYQEALAADIATRPIEVRNGYLLKRQPTPDGTLIQVVGGKAAFRDLNAARRLADALPPGSATMPDDKGLPRQ